MAGMNPEWRFTQRDLEYLVETLMSTTGDVEDAAARLRSDERLLSAMLDDEDLFDRLLGEEDRGPALPPSTASPPQASALVEPLSERELSVLRLLSEGKTNQQIAGEIFVSVNTIKSHLKNIYGKLGVNNRREAVAQARVRSLLPD